MHESVNPRLASGAGKLLVGAGLLLGLYGLHAVPEDTLRFDSLAQQMDASDTCTQSIRDLGTYLYPAATPIETSAACPELATDEILKLKTLAQKIDLDNKGWQGGLIFMGIGAAALVYGKFPKHFENRYS